MNTKIIEPKKVTYQGQRYEVRAKNRDGIWRVIGWTNQANGQRVIQSVCKAGRGWRSPKVVDLYPERG